MRGYIAACLTIVIAASLVLPIGLVDRESVSPDGMGQGGDDSSGPLRSIAESIDFAIPLDTSATVPEYSMLARALMLPGGSTYSTLADINRDGRTDLIVAVSDAKMVSIFYRQNDGSFLSYPSHNITMNRNPIGVAVLDSYADGNLDILVLERRSNDTDNERLLILNYTSDNSYYEFQNLSVYKTASTFVIGRLDGDVYPDIAFVCPTIAPLSNPGVVEIRLGPDYGTSIQFNAGRGSCSIALGNLSGDALPDLAVSNYVDGNISLFYQPFSFGDTPDRILATPLGHPLSIVSADLSSDGLDDIAALTDNSSQLLFYLQSSGMLQPNPDDAFSRSLSPDVASRLFAGDLNDDDKEDLLILSETQSKAFGILQRSTTPIWPLSYDFAFPTGSIARHAMIGWIDSDSSPDIVISSARANWTGSSVSIYYGRLPVMPMFSNSDSTIWQDSSSVATRIATGDLNGNGLTDIALLCPASTSFEIIQLVGDMRFNKSLSFVPNGLLVKDMNGDGFDDILISRENGKQLNVSFGRSDLSGILDSLELNCQDNITDIGFGDFNNDSRIDILASTDNGTLNIFFNTGSVTMPYDVAYVLAPKPGTPIPAVVAGDFNSDGKDDVAFSLPSLAINISFQKDASPYILPQPDATLFHGATGVFSELWSGDLNGDTKTDIAAMRSSDVSVFMFDQNHFISPRTPYDWLDLPEPPRFVSVLDATDDGFADVVATFESADLLFLYKQSGGVIPAGPSMVFVTGASPDCAIVQEATAGSLQSMMVYESVSHSMSAWRQVNNPPVVDAGGPYSGIQGQEVSFAGSATDSVSQMDDLEYRWDFGDGNASDWSMDPEVTHVYVLEGLYSVMLEVKDPGNLTSFDISSVSVLDSYPLVDFGWSPANPAEGETVTFTENSSSFDEVVLINWTLNGMLVDSGMNHVMDMTFQNGTYSIGLEVMDDDGSLRSVTKWIVVLRAAPKVTISAPTSATEDDLVTFTVELDLWHSGIGDYVSNYEWNFSYQGVFLPDRITSGNQTSWEFETSADKTFTVAVRVTDNDGDQSIGFFNIGIFDRTKVSIEIQSSGPYLEFNQVNLSATADASHPAILFEWQFDATPSGLFVPDTSTLTGAVTHIYLNAGNYLVKVKVTVSNGSWAMDETNVFVEDIVPEGTFDEYVVLTRNPDQTSDLTFNATSLAAKYPDILRTFWSFGDGVESDTYGGPNQIVHHLYVPDRDYEVFLNVTDDDGTTLHLAKTLKLNAPTIQMISPTGDSVIRAGTSVRFVIGDDSPPLLWVRYSLNGGQLTEFATQWEISTTGWQDDDYSLVIKAADKDGNIAVKDDVVIVVDDKEPVVTVLWNVTSIFGGDSVNISVVIDEAHIDNGSVILYIKLPGSSSYSHIVMNSAGENTFYAIVEIPKHSGTLLFNVSVSDMAENSVFSETYSVAVKLHFIDVAWPFLLGLAILASLGTAAYFVREAKIAVDETFVIYNDGRLISHSTRHLKPGMDDQVLSGMFVAIQDFVKDSFKDVTSFTLRKLEFGEKSVLIEKGDHLFLAVILHGKASKKVAAKMQRIVDEIEEEFSNVLKVWDGDLDSLRGVGDIAKKLYSKAPLLPPFRRSNT